MGSSLERIDLLRDISKGGKCIEIGVWKGDFAQIILDTLKPEKLFLIDPWKAQEYNGAWYNCSQEDMDEVHSSVLRRFSREIVKGQVELIPMYSANASLLFSEGSLDFIYIDGCHLYEFVRDDLEFFFPKLKHGGIMMGDDYDIKGWWHNGVSKAVDEFQDSFLAEKTIVKDQFILRKK